MDNAKAMLEYAVARMDDQQAAQLLEKANVEFDSVIGKVRVKNGKVIGDKGQDVQVGVTGLRGLTGGADLGNVEGDHAHIMTQVNSGESVVMKRAAGDKTGQVFETVGEIPSHEALRRHEAFQQPAQPGSPNDPKVVESKATGQPVRASIKRDPEPVEQSVKSPEQSVKSPDSKISK